MDKIQKPRRSERANRPRAARACDGCRRVKERCEGGMPCRRCSHLKRRCEFTGPTVRFPVGAGSGGIGGDLAGASSSTAHRQPEDMDAATRSLFDTQVAEGAPQGLKRSRSRATADDSDSSDQVNIDDITVQPLENNVTHYSGEFSHFNFSMRIKNWIEKSGPYRTDAPDAPKIREFYRVEELQSPSDPSGLISSCPPRYIADFLVRAFFNHAEGNYFYVDRTWLNRKMDLVYDAPASLSRRDVPMLCVLFMVLAIGTQYAYLDSDAWRHGGGVEEVNTFSEDSVGIMLYQQACKLLPDVITISSSESVQACLLIGLYTLPLDPSGLSWVYLGLAMKLAVQNGMHRRYPGQSSDLAMVETRNRVWWTCYMVEKRVGTFHGRPTSIASQEVDADWPTERPNIWPGSPPQNTPQLVATLQLSQFLSRISHIISCFKTNDKQTTLLALHRLNMAKDELHQWWNSLPEEVSRTSADAQQTAESPNSSAVPRAAFHLRLEFCMLRMYAGRPFITPRDESNPHKASTSKSPPTTHPREDVDASPGHGAGSAPGGGSSSGNTPSSQSSSRHRSALVSDCVDAAITVVDICRTLQTGIGLARASYTEFSTLRIALLVILSQFLAKYQKRPTTPTATNALRQPLGDGIAMLKSMSTWGASARFDASLIEAFEHTIARMENSSGRGENRAEAQRPKESNYEMFKRWESMWQGGAQGNGHRHNSNMSKASSSTRNDAGIMEGSADMQPVPPPAPAPPPFGEDPLGNAWDGMGADAAPVASGPETGSSFGIDWNYSSMPMLEGLSAMLEQGYGFGVDMESQQDGTGRMDY